MHGGRIQEFAAARIANHFDKHTRNRGPVGQSIARSGPFFCSGVDKVQIVLGRIKRQRPVRQDDFFAAQADRAVDKVALAGGAGFAACPLAGYFGGVVFGCLGKAASGQSQYKATR